MKATESLDYGNSYGRFPSPGHSFVPRACLNYRPIPSTAAERKSEISWRSLPTRRGRPERQNGRTKVRSSYLRPLDYRRQLNLIIEPFLGKTVMSKRETRF